jgi:hypothetical protein
LQVDIDGDEGKACSNQAAVTRADEAWLNSDENIYSVTVSDLEDFGSKVDGVYYYVQGSQATCTENELIQEKATDVRAAWLNAGKNMVSVD